MSKFENPYRKPHSGTAHFIMQRLSAVALIPLVLYLLCAVVSLAGSDNFTEVTRWFASPFNCALIVLFLIIGFYHGALGLQIIIEDYIANINLRWTLVLASRALAVVFALTGAIAVLRLAVAFGG